MDPLLEALKHRDKETVQAWSKGEQWLTVEHFMDAHDGRWYSVCQTILQGCYQFL